MHLDLIGEGPDLVLIHGTPQDPRDLESLVTRMRGWRVTLVHLPGYGRSAPAERVDLDQSAADLLATLIAHGITRPLLVGISAGSYRALQLTLRSQNDETFAAFVPIGIMGLAPVAGFDDEGKARLRGFADALDAGADLRPAVAGAWFSPAFAQAHPERVAAVADSALGATSPAQLAAELRALGEAEDLLPRLSELRCPLRVRVGSLDAATPLHYAEAIAKAARGEVEVADGAGHLLHYEDLDATCASILELGARCRAE